MVATSKRLARTPAGQPAGRRRYQVSRDFDSSKKFLGSFVCVVTVYARFPIPRMTFFGNIRVFWHLSASAHGEPMQSINSFDFPFPAELSISRI